MEHTAGKAVLHQWPAEASLKFYEVRGCPSGGTGINLLVFYSPLSYSPQRAVDCWFVFLWLPLCLPFPPFSSWDLLSFLVPCKLVVCSPDIWGPHCPLPRPSSHAAGSSAKTKKNFTPLLGKDISSIIFLSQQFYFLTAGCAALCWEGVQSRMCCSRLVFNDHFWDQITRELGFCCIIPSCSAQGLLVLFNFTSPSFSAVSLVRLLTDALWVVESFWRSVCLQGLASVSFIWNFLPAAFSSAAPLGGSSVEHVVPCRQSR